MRLPEYVLTDLERLARELYKYEPVAITIYPHIGDKGEISIHSESLMEATFPQHSNLKFTASDGTPCVTMTAERNGVRYQSIKEVDDE